MHTVFFCSFPLPLSSTRLVAVRHPPKKQWMELAAGSWDPVALWKVQVAHHSNLKSFCKRNSPCEVSATFQHSNRICESLFFFSPKFGITVITFHLFNLFKLCFFVFLEAKEQIPPVAVSKQDPGVFFWHNSWGCGMITFLRYPRCLWWFLKQARFRPPFGSWKWMRRIDSPWN